jgi:uncharacterized membrane protein
VSSSVKYPTSQKDDILRVVINTFKLAGQSWEALKLNLITFIWILILPLLLVMAMISALMLALSSYSAAGGSFAFNEASLSSLSIETIALLSVGLLGIIVLLVLLTIASIVVQLESVRGKKITFQDAINRSLSFFWRIVGLGVLCILIIFAGLILFIVPGLLALFFLVLSGYVLIDQNTGIKQAIVTSYNLTKKHWKVVLALIVVNAVINIPGTIEGIGSIVATILAIVYYCLPAIIYLRIKKSSPKILAS